MMKPDGEVSTPGRSQVDGRGTRPGATPTVLGASYEISFTLKSRVVPLTS